MSAEKGVSLINWSRRHIALSVIGKLDVTTAWEVRHLVEALFVPRTRHVSIDFRHCEEFTGTGLEILFDFLFEMEARGIAVELSGIAQNRFVLFRDSIRDNTRQVRQDEGERYSIYLMGRRDS